MGGRDVVGGAVSGDLSGGCGGHSGGGRGGRAKVPAPHVAGRSYGSFSTTLGRPC